MSCACNVNQLTNARMFANFENFFFHISFTASEKDEECYSPVTNYNKLSS